MSKPHISSSTLALSVDFPTELRGYKRSAVDAFIAELSVRLSGLEADLDTQVERCEAAELELAAARQNLLKYADKETALVDAVLAAEKRRAAIDSEFADKRIAAQREADRIVAEARSQGVAARDSARKEAETLLQTARREAEELGEAARAAAEKENGRLETLRNEFTVTLNKMRDELQALLALLPEPALGTSAATLEAPEGMEEPMAKAA